jgi:hypothetical protein
MSELVNVPHVSELTLTDLQSTHAPDLGTDF